MQTQMEDLGWTLGIHPWAIKFGKILITSKYS